MLAERCGARAGGEPAEVRKQLRSGAFAGVRENIRAVGEWAAAGAASGERPASVLVSAVFSTLQAGSGRGRAVSL